MNIKILVGVILIALGILAFIYKGFSYTKEEKVVDLGPLQATADVQKQVEVPTWAAVTLVVVGGVILVFSRR